MRRIKDDVAQRSVMLPCHTQHLTLLLYRHAQDGVCRSKLIKTRFILIKILPGYLFESLDGNRISF